jgi:membrane protease YdiL (CAAX protease family)
MLSKRSQGIELGVFLLLIAPQIVVASLVRETLHVTFPSAATSVVVRDIGFVVLVFFFLSRNGESAREIGWTFQKGLRSIVFATLTFPLVFLGLSLAQMLLLRLGLSAPAHARSYFVMQSPTELPLLGYFAVTNGTAEEIIFRGYLILRFTALTGRFWAVVLSSALFGLAHVYQGTASALSIGCLGLLFALIYVQTRSLVIPIIWHCLQDFVAILLASSHR